MSQSPWIDCVVPISVELVLPHFDRCEFLVRDLNALFVLALIERCVDSKSLSRCGVADQIDNDGAADEWFASPILGDVAEHPMLNLVPLTGPRREMAHGDPKIEVIRKLLKTAFPQPRTTAVTPSRVCCNQQLPRLRVDTRSHFPPPTSNRGNGKLRRVAINADADPPFVLRDIVNTIGNRNSQLFVSEVVHPHALR